MRHHVLAMALAVANPAMAATPSKPAPLAIASKWQLDYSPTSCRLLAAFGPDRDTVEFSQADPRAPLRLTMASKAWPQTAVARNVAVWVNDREPITGLKSAPLPPIDHLPILYITYAPGLYEALAAAGADTPAVLSAATAGRTRSYVLGKISPLLRAFDRCMDDLVKTWGFDPAQQRAASAPTPIGQPSSWFNSDDYPLSLIRENKAGGVYMRFDVDASGKVTDCHVQETGGASEFEALTCKLIKDRGRYEPAKSTSGDPIPTYAFLKVNWLMPGH